MHDLVAAHCRAAASSAERTTRTAMRGDERPTLLQSNIVHLAYSCLRRNLSGEEIRGPLPCCLQRRGVIAGRILLGIHQC
jgi:hypothetical protein